MGLSTLLRKAAKASQEAKITPKRSNKGKGQPISETDIKEAKTANAFSTMQRRINDMPDGTRKKMMQSMLDSQMKKFESGQAADVDRAARASTQANRDRTMKGNVSLPEMKKGTPDREMNKGSLVQPKDSQTGLKKLPTAVRNKMGYMNRGGLAKSGSTDMRKGGMFY